jgi:hypothetical protein
MALNDTFGDKILLNCTLFKGVSLSSLAFLSIVSLTSTLAFQELESTFSHPPPPSSFSFVKPRKNFIPKLFVRLSKASSGWGCLHLQYSWKAWSAGHVPSPPLALAQAEEMLTKEWCALLVTSGHQNGKQAHTPFAELHQLVKSLVFIHKLVINSSQNCMSKFLHGCKVFCPVG